jgi:hypothetical protein
VGVFESCHLVRRVGLGGCSMLAVRRLAAGGVVKPPASVWMSVLYTGWTCCLDGVVVGTSARRVEGLGFDSRRGHAFGSVDVHLYDTVV